jgi:hypothetical protein
VKRFCIAVAVLGAAVLLSPRAAEGQLTRGVLTGAERDSEGQSMLLAGGWVGRAGLGWNPVAGVIAYRLAYGDDAAATVVWAANPYAGLRRQWSRGGLQANVGYSFRDDGVADFDPAGRQQVTSGLTTGLQGEYAATRAVSFQGIATYSWGDDGYLWSRGRALHAVGDVDVSAVRLGADLVYQGNETYHAYEAGPVLEWRAWSGVALIAGAGWRRGVVPHVDTHDLAYARLEFVLAR